MQHVVPKDTVIAAGASLSSQITGTHGTPGGGVDMEGQALVGIEMPSAWTAASVSLSVSSDGVNFKTALKEDGTEWSASVAASQSLPISPLLSASWRFIKVRSGTSGAAVNQAAERTIRLLSREFN